MAILEPVISQVDRGVSAPPIPSRRRRRLGPGFEDGLMSVGLVAGPANVIMELARPGVGYGVMESKVESGRADRHPIKRARTTFTYLAVATRGSDEQKKAYRSAVNKSHAQVHSTPDSPVQYNAFDKDLQLWVAACLYKGGVDIARIFIGEMDDETADRQYRESMALATTLQVPADAQADRAAFDRYWQESLDKVYIDDTIREYLYPFAVSRVRGVRLPGQQAIERFNLLITTGFLPQRFREEMRLEWNADTQRKFDRLMAVIRFFNNLTPRLIREFPFNLLLRDVDWRLRTGRPLV